MKISKLFTSFGIALTLILFTVQLCEAANTLTCWHAYEDDGTTQSTIGHYMSSPFVGKVRTYEHNGQVSNNAKAAEALVNGVALWNADSKASRNLGFALRYLPYASTSTYNVEFIAGNRTLVRNAVGGICDAAIAKTLIGNLDNGQIISYNSRNRTIYEYTANNSNGQQMMRVGLIFGEIEAEAEDGPEPLAERQAAALARVSAHEIGHVLGWRGHSNRSDMLMHPSGNNWTIDEVMAKDIAHIKQFYELGN